MSSRSRSPEKQTHSKVRDATHLESLRSGADATSRRLDRGNPQTPPAQRFISSTYSSPGSVLGREEDAIIFELTPRYLLAGIQGESNSQCQINFSPGNDRRVGDYGEWLPEFSEPEEEVQDWGLKYELWRNDISSLDLGFIGDRLERSIREAYNKYLLLDAGLARIVLVLPSLVPHPVLDTILTTLFQRWKFPSITLLPAPTMAALSAGLRSALVIDIGWEDTAVTAIHEFRELHTSYSTRAMKTVSKKLAGSLQALRSQQTNPQELRFDLEFVEEVFIRGLPFVSFHEDENLAKQTEQLAIADKTQDSGTSKATAMEIDWPAQKSVQAGQDDDEIAVSMLAFKTLQGLSTDVRAACISRIIFTGQLASHANVKSRIIHDLGCHIKQDGWSSVRGTRLRPHRFGLAELAQERANPADASYSLAADHAKDYVEDRVRQQKAKRTQTSSTPVQPREMESLGSWTGASILASLKVRGFVEIERDRYLSHGILGSSRDVEQSVVAQPQRMSSFGLPKNNKSQDRTSWTLAGWG